MAISPFFEGSGMTKTILQNVRSHVPSRTALSALAFASLAALAAVGSVGPSVAGPAGLSGAWSGGGWVMSSTGNKEKARCHASYSRVSGDAYALSATCATSSGKASQTATVYKVANGRYRGSFFNQEYNVR